MMPRLRALGKFIRGLGWKPSVFLKGRPARRSRRSKSRIRSWWLRKRRSPSLRKRSRTFVIGDWTAFAKDTVAVVSSDVVGRGAESLRLAALHAEGGSGRRDRQG